MNVPKINKLNERVLNTARILVLFWLMGWFLKVSFFQEYLFKTVKEYPFVSNHFPLFFQLADVAQFFYIFPLFALLVFVRRTKFYFFFAAAVMMLSSAVLLLHQDTHNDATFLTSFWVGLWFFWFSCNMHRLDDDFVVHARSLALCVVGMIFAGGFVGKLTADYWDGKVFAQIFMEQNYGLIGNWIRGRFDEQTIRFHFEWISKCMILGEGVLAFAPFLPYRFVTVFGIFVMIGISFFTTWLIFSVLLCLIGLLIAVGKLRKNV